MKALPYSVFAPQDQIYLDYQATTPTDPRVVDAMLPYFSQNFGNPHSRNHIHGWMAEEAVEVARFEIASLINADESEIIFVSGATEANNIAIKGVAEFYKSKKNHIITVKTEHKCVIESFRDLESKGFNVTYLPVLKNGLIDLNVLKDSITEQTSLVSIMNVNNEIGVIQDIFEIGKICKERGVFFHTDAAQALGKIDVDVSNVDLMSLSGHKVYGPKGIGALYIRKKPKIRLKPIIHGGAQERGIRPGTLSPALCVGFGAACSIVKNEMKKEVSKQEITRIKTLTKKLHDGIIENIEYATLNGDLEKRVPGNLNFSFAFIEGEGLMMGIKEISVSSGSACTSASLEPSYVLRALGLSDELAHSSIRFGIGRFTTEKEIVHVIKSLTKAVNRLREMSPLYEDFLENGKKF